MYTLRIINNLSGDDDSMVDVPLSCGMVRAYVAACVVSIVTGKDVALLERVGHAFVTVLLLEA